MPNMPRWKLSFEERNVLFQIDSKKTQIERERDLVNSLDEIGLRV